jgi:OH-DDVA oxygenase
MAEIVTAIGTSHGPLLNTPPDQWGERAKFDRRQTALVYQGREYPFDELRELRDAAYEDDCRPEVWAARHRACRTALTRLGEHVAAANLDALVIVSSDHKEIYGDELLPAFAVYWGDTVEHVPFTREQLDAMPPGLAVAAVGDQPEVPTTRPCHPELALHLIREAGASGFDVSASKQLPPGRYGNHGIPHGWGFVYQQVLNGRPIPFVPVFVNTFYEPNPPSPGRCYDFGRALGEAIAAFPGQARVGVVASGGLTHFVVDEELDRPFLEALRARDEDALRSLDPAFLRSGTSELLNWVVAAGALAATGLEAEIVDYQPCYRTEAGTGCAMAFAAWREA